MGAGQFFYKSSPHSFRVVETHGSRDGLDRLRTVLQAKAGSLDTKSLDRLGGRFTRLLAEGAPKLAGTEPRHLGEAFERERFSQMVAREGERDPHPVGLGFHER